MLTKIKGYSPRICPVYPRPECRDVVPLFEDRAVYKSITAQIESAGCTVSEENDADIYLFCNLPVGQMLDFAVCISARQTALTMLPTSSMSIATCPSLFQNLPDFMQKARPLPLPT